MRPAHSCTSGVAVVFAHLKSEVRRECSSLGLPAAACDTTGCQRMMGKWYERNDFSAIFYFKQSQLECAVKIGWKCWNLTPTFSLKSWPSVEQRKVKLTWSDGLGGVARIKRGPDLMPVLASMLADICSMMWCSLTSWALVPSVTAHGWWTSICSLCVAVFLGVWAISILVIGFSLSFPCLQTLSQCLILYPGAGLEVNPQPMPCSLFIYRYRASWQTGLQFSVHASDDLREVQLPSSILLSVLACWPPPPKPGCLVVKETCCIMVSS